MDSTEPREPESHLKKPATTWSATFSGCFQLPVVLIARKLRRPIIKVLLVEDDREIANRLADGLTGEGFTVEQVHNGSDALAIGLDDTFDAVILDLGLPQMQGLEVLRAWRRQNRNFPVLILTARGTWSEKVDGLNAGADDYITKPFHVPEVSARLKALIRRTSGLASPLLKHGRVVLDTTSGRATFDDKPLDLTARELRLLNYFMHHVGRVVSQNELIEHLYTVNDNRESNTVEVYISRLRRKTAPEIITTIRGLGYRMD